MPFICACAVYCCCIINIATIIMTHATITTRVIFITASLFFLYGVFFFAGVVFAHGDEEHDTLPSEVSVCHAISPDEREACYLTLCEGAVVEECMEDIVDAAMAGSGSQFATAVLTDLVAVESFDADVYALAQRMGRILGERLVRGEENQFGACGGGFGYGCVYGFFEAFASSVDDSVESDAVLAERICVTAANTDVAQQEMCYHKMGHVFMKRGGHALIPALLMCDALVPEFQPHCWDGVFMENVNENLASGGGDGFIDEDLLAPCGAVEEQYREKCYKNHGRYLLRRFDDVPVSSADACVGAGAYEGVCRQSVDNALSGDGHHHHGTVKALTVDLAAGEEQDTSRSWLQKMLDGIVSFFAALFGGAEEGGEHHDETEHTHDESDHTHEEMSAGDGMVSFAFPRGGDIPDAISHDAVVVTYREGQYQPDTVSVRHGQVVMWVNEDSVFWPAANLHPTHKEYPGSGILKCETDERALIFDACEAMGPGAVYAFLFNEAGEWHYHDHINPRATGVVLVSE